MEAEELNRLLMGWNRVFDSVMKFDEVLTEIEESEDEDDEDFGDEDDVLVPA